MSCVVSWRPVVEDVADASPDLIDRATDRLDHGDVRRTQYGIRVALRPDLDDDRSALSESIGRPVLAYWPARGCLCWAWKSNGMCSHVLAARAYAAGAAAMFDALIGGSR